MPQNVGADGKEKIQGGTAVNAASNRVTLIALGLLVGVIVLVVMARRGSDSKSHTPGASATGPAPAVSAQPIASGAQVAPAAEEPDVGFTGTDAAVNTPANVRSKVLVSMEEQLAGRRLWATVTADQDVPTDIIVSSAACTDINMKGTLELTAEQLKAAGFTGLRCVEKNGALAFKLEL